LLTPCEIAVKSVIPAVRAHVAKELSQTHEMKQNDIAQLLGITQTAVSKYIGNVRGQAIKIDQAREIRFMMDDLASKVAHGKVSGPQLILKFCEVCSAIRGNGLMCSLCKQSNPTLDIRVCKVCRNGKLCSANV